MSHPLPPLGFVSRRLQIQARVGSSHARHDAIDFSNRSSGRPPYGSTLADLGRHPTRECHDDPGRSMHTSVLTLPELGLGPAQIGTCALCLRV